MTDAQERTAIQQWLDGEWTPEQGAVITIATYIVAMARKPWWHRRKPHPMDFVPVARDAVTILVNQGWTPPGSGSLEAGSDG